MMATKLIADQLRAAMGAAGLTVEQLAVAAGIHSQSAYKALRGGNVTLAVLAKLAHALGADLTTGR